MLAYSHTCILAHLHARIIAYLHAHMLAYGYGTWQVDAVPEEEPDDDAPSGEDDGPTAEGV